jgi:uncharacterized membrane protein YjgN (DUF898 family)
MAAVAAVLSAQPEPQKLVYTGELGTLYRIAAVNLLLSILTLGFYRFWGRAKLRRYLWGSMVLDGDAFEWDGTGWEMCRSFLIVSAIALVLSAPAYALTLAGPAYAEQLAAYQTLLGLVIMMLIGAATMLGLRYRLSRSRWRGIRGDLEGSPWAYSWRNFGWLLAHAPTLFLIHPLATIDLRRWLIRRVRPGTVTLECHARAGAVYPAFFGTIALSIALLALFFALLFGGIVTGAVVGVLSDVSQEEVEEIGFVVGLVLMLLVLAAWPCASAIYHASLFRHLAATTRGGSLTFVTEVSGARLFWLRFSNFLILGITLGIGLPFVWHRRARFLAANLAVLGLEDAHLIGQAAGRPTRSAEGLLEVLDLGAV